LWMMRQWRHLKMLMHAGHGNDGICMVKETEQSKLALSCPACPHPNINLPVDWNKSDNLYLIIDACFRLKRCLISSILNDPYLVPGWAYLVEPEGYRKYLLTVTDQDEMCTCTGLRAALDYANTRISKGYTITGAAMCCCAHHGLVGKNTAGLLQKGER
ncbi:hypothetical protein BT96DRAFT_832191, partial [Gymnopus androsaceus JB14]